MKGIAFKFWRIVIILFAMSVWKYKHFVLFPTLTLDVVKGENRYVDLQFEILCFGFGVRFGWRTKRKC